MNKLTKKIKIFYALGTLGSSLLTALVGTWLIYFYMPPESSGILAVIPQQGIFLGITVIGLVTGLATAVDAFTDPWIASLSDKLKGKNGRRIPFLRRSALPFAVLMALIFIVPVQGEIHSINVIYLFIIFIVYIIALTAYTVPHAALLAELGHTTEERLDLATYTSIAWFVGFVAATFASSIWDGVMQVTSLEKTQAIQLTIGILAVIAFIFMAIPAWGIDEKKYCKSKPVSIDMKQAIRNAFKHKDFRIFVISELGYWLSNGFFQATLVYYITVLAGQKENMVGMVVTINGIFSFLLYPLVNKLSKLYGKKKMMILAYLVMVVSFIYISFLGRLPFGGFVQLLPVIVLFAIPNAVTGILPNAIIADCSVYNTIENGQNSEGVYFAVRSFLSKCGITFSAIILPSLLALGNSVSNDIGIRLSVFVAAGAALISMLVFMKYDEKKILAKIENK